MATETKNRMDGVDAEGAEAEQAAVATLKRRKNGKQEGRIEKCKISPPNMQVVEVKIRGNAPYVQCAFSKKAQETMKRKQEQGSQAVTGQKRAPRNFQEDYLQGMHRATEGWCGIPATAIRAAMVSACRLIGFKMTLGKLALFVVADGFDAIEVKPLIKITKGEPQYYETYGRNSDGSCDLRARPMWAAGWEAVVRIRYDADIFSANDILNLMSRVGDQVGVGEGRPDSKKSVGQGWGTFNVLGTDELND